MCKISSYGDRIRGRIHLKIQFVNTICYILKFSLSIEPCYYYGNFRHTVHKLCLLGINSKHMHLCDMLNSVWFYSLILTSV